VEVRGAQAAGATGQIIIQFMGKCPCFYAPACRCPRCNRGGHLLAGIPRLFAAGHHVDWIRGSLLGAWVIGVAAVVGLASGATLGYVLSIFPPPALATGTAMARRGILSSSVRLLVTCNSRPSLPSLWQH